MKVAFYIGRLNRGGAETLLADIFSMKETLPFEPLCVYRSEGNLSDAFHSTGVRMKRLPRKKSWLVYMIRLRYLLLSEKVEIVHAQTSLNAIIAILCTLFTPIKVVNTFHGFGFARSPKILRRFVFRGCDRLVFVSDYEKSYYLQLGDFGVRNKCEVVYNGVNFDKFKLKDHKSESDELINICMVGSFAEGRNHLFVCKFINHLKQKGVNFHFTFIGGARVSEPKVYEDCVNYCTEHDLMNHVTFAGLCDDVPQLLATMDAFVYATRHDSFGIAVMEAIASGLPTFVNDWGVMNELTKDGKLASLYESNNIDSLYEKFVHFLHQRSEYQSDAYNNALEVRMIYSIENHIANLARIYYALLSPHLRMKKEVGEGNSR